MGLILIPRSGSDIPPVIAEAFRTNATGIPDYVTPEYLAESQDATTIGGIIFLLVMAAVIYFLRAYGRIFVVKAFGIDDWLAGLSLVCHTLNFKQSEPRLFLVFSEVYTDLENLQACYIAFSALCIGIIKTGACRHNEYVQYIVTNPQLDLAQILDFWAHLIYATALFVCRMSGIALYYRLSDRNRKLVVTVWIAAGFLIVGFIPQIFLIVFHCKPVTALWPNYFQPNVDDYECLPWFILYATNSTISITSDLVIFCIPIAIISKLKANRKTKLALSAVLLPGVLVIIVSAFRLWIVIQSNGVFIDTSWVYGPQLVVECAEVGLTIIALSIPGLKPLFQNWFSNMSLSMKSYGRSRGTSRPTNNHSGHKDTNGILSQAECYARAPSEPSISDRERYGNSMRDSYDELPRSGEGRKGIAVTTTIMQMRDLAGKKETDP